MGVIKLCDLECLPLVRVDSPLRDILKYTYIYNILIIFIYLFLTVQYAKSFQHTSQLVLINTTTQ